MRIRTLFVATLAVFSAFAGAQFDFGGGASGPSEPWKEFKLNGSKLKLDFRNANVDSVISLYSRASGISIVKDPSLTGPITVTSATAIPLDQAFQILSTTLSLKGYEMRKEGSLLFIRKRKENWGREVAQGNSMMGGMNPDDLRRMFEGNRGELKVYPIQYANATQVARVINEVFANMGNPMEQMLQQLMGGGFSGGNNQGGRGNQGGGRGNFNFGGGRGGFRGGFGGFGSSQTVRASADDYSNSVIVNAPSGDHRQVADLIRQIDKETDAPLQSRVYKLDFALAADIAPAIQNVLTANAPKGRGGVGSTNIPIEQRFQQAFRFGSMQAAFGTVVTDARTNSLIVTATDDNLKLVAEVIKELDVDIKYESSVFVFPLENARADQVSTLLNQAFGTRSGGGNQNTRTNSVGQRNPNQRNNRNNMGGGNFGGGRGRTSNDDPNSLYLDFEDPESASGELLTSIEVAQGGGFNRVLGGQGQGNQGQNQTGRDPQGRLVPVQNLSGQVSVIADQNTNSLIVVGTPENADLIRGILGQLDRIPEQVMIETIIVEATLDSSNKLGVEWNLSNNKPFGNPNANDSTATNFGLQNANPALQGFRYTLTGGNLTAFINALQTDQKFKVLSTPRIFTSNNAEAQINISQRVPYVLSSREDVNGNLTFTYAFEDVGIVLTVTPRITANGYVTMEINQTANDLQGFTSFNAPIINQRQADTTVSVKDGETIVLGGIIRSTVTSTTRKVPLLGDIPILGKLFQSTDKQNVQTELMVFLTPRVVRDDGEARKLRDEHMKDLSKESQKNVGKIIPPPLPDKPDNSSGGTKPPATKPPGG
jgi:general secretion pathway protein D